MHGSIQRAFVSFGDIIAVHNGYMYIIVTDRLILTNKIYHIIIINYYYFTPTNTEPVGLKIKLAKLV